MGPTALRGIRATGDTLSNVESQVFTPYKFGSTARDRTPDLLTTRPTCYHSAKLSVIYSYVYIHTSGLTREIHEFGGQDLLRTIHRYSRFLALLG